MTEYHGWLVVRASLDGDDSEPDGNEKAMRRVRGLLDQLSPDFPGLADLRPINGTVQLHVADSPNRSGPRVDRVLDIIRETARTAPGSYGLVYVRDEESREHDNEFRVLVIRRGEIVERPDPFLSPFIPTVDSS